MTVQSTNRQLYFVFAFMLSSFWQSTLFLTCQFVRSSVIRDVWTRCFKN